MLISGSKVALFAVVASLLMAVGCGSGNTTGQLRVMHASPGEPNLDVYVDGKIMASELAYGGNTGYFNLNPGSHNVQLDLTGTTTTVLTQSVNLASSTETTIIAYNIPTKITALVLSDNNTAPTSGDIELRFVNAAPGLGTVDVYVIVPGSGINSAPPIVSGLGFGSASAYQPFTETTTQGTGYEVLFTITGTRVAPIDTGSLSFASAEIQTIVALSNSSGGYTFATLTDYE